MKNSLKRILALVLGAGMLLGGVGCSGSSEDKVPEITTEFLDNAELPQFVEPADDEEVALLVTEKGNILVRFCAEGAPKAVENFVTHAKEQYYDGTVFHRTIEGFMIQGGDPEGTGMGGESIWGEGFGMELTDDLFHFTGALAMAQTSQPDSIGSQFYIVQGIEIPSEYADIMRAGAIDNGTQGYYYPTAAINQYEKLGGYPWLDQGYTVFGQVLGGMDVVNEIAAGKVLDGNGTAADPVKLKKVIVMPYSEAREKAGK